MVNLIIAFSLGALLALFMVLYKRYKANKAYKKFEKVTEEIKDLASEQVAHQNAPEE
jgi:hypothetical protein